jgi:hypothetical protein
VSRDSITQNRTLRFVDRYSFERSLPHGCSRSAVATEVVHVVGVRGHRSVFGFRIRRPGVATGAGALRFSLLSASV